MRRHRIAFVVAVALGSAGCGEGVDWTTVTSAIAGQGQPETGYPATGILVLQLPDKVIQSCTGTLIRSDAVLSAAHCIIDDTGKPAPVLSAEFQLGQPPTPSQRLPIFRYRVHGKYIAELQSRGIAEARPYDAAVFFLTKPATGVAPAALSGLGAVR